MQARRFCLSLIGTGILLSLPACDAGRTSPSSSGPSTTKPDRVAASTGGTPAGFGDLLDPAPPPPKPAPVNDETASRKAVDPIVVGDCQLRVIQKQEVPAEREGKIMFIGTPVKAGETWPEDQIFYIRPGYSLPIEPKDLHGRVSMASGLVVAEIAPASSGVPVRLTSHLSTALVADARPTTEVEKFRKLKEGDRVEAGQLIARLDTVIARLDVTIKSNKVDQAKSEFITAEKTRDETHQRWVSVRDVRLSGGQGASSKEEVNERKLAYDRYYQEAISKKSAISVANSELEQAQAVVDKHDIRAHISGIIKVLNKKPGEAVKAGDTIGEIHNLDKLFVEGLLDLQYLPRVRKGMRVIVEATQSESPLQTLTDHIGGINGVGVFFNAAKENVIASGSDDGTIRLWKTGAKRPYRILTQLSEGKRIPIRCLAVTGMGADKPRLITGGSDSTARVWDPDQKEAAPVLELKGKHKGNITCVAFSLDGKYCATGGDDRDIWLWDAATGAPKYSFPQAHTSGITSLQFTAGSQLVSTARDNTLRLWTLGTLGARVEKAVPNRTGDVPQLGVSPDGAHVLFEQGKTLRIMTLPDLVTDGLLQNPSGATNFTTFALFSPDSQLVLTAGASEGRLQLWRTPTPTTRGYEVRQYSTVDHSPATAAAFSPFDPSKPNDAFVVVGSKSGLISVWPMVSKQEIEHQYTAELTLVEPSVEGAGHQVRIRAEIENKDNRLLPGNTVTMGIYPN